MKGVVSLSLPLFLQLLSISHDRLLLSTKTVCCTDLAYMHILQRYCRKLKNVCAYFTFKENQLQSKTNQQFIIGSWYHDPSWNFYRDNFFPSSFEVKDHAFVLHFSLRLTMKACEKGGVFRNIYNQPIKSWKLQYKSLDPRLTELQ